MKKLGIGLLVSFVVGCGGGARSPVVAGGPTSTPSTEASLGGAPTGAAAEPGAPAGESTSAAPIAEASRASAAGRPTATSGSTALPAPPPPADAAPSKAPAALASSEASSKKEDAAIATSPPFAGRPEPRSLPRSGQLTAGVWDDNLNFDFFKPYAARFAERSSDYAMFRTAEVDAALKGSLERHAKRTDLDVQIVLDTTGSMGDELSYLQSEFDSIANQLKTRFPNVSPRWSLVVYRDHGDEYLTRNFDFTTDTNRFRTELRAQAAGGGGDTPEAVVEGLEAGLRQQWRGGSNVAKLAFWVADAPAHPGEGQKLASVVRSAQAKGVHLYPVASSDADEAAEFQMRTAAQMTGGRYVFLTNDSGVGNGHAEPHIPCYNVTRLDRAIVRMIAVELEGRYVEADSQDVVRSVGQPGKDGKCRLSSGMLVASY